MRTIIAGGGLMGAAVAHLLARRGEAVDVLDVKRPGNATWAGAGIICPEISAVTDPDYVALAMAAGRYYEEFVDGLSDYDIGFGRTAIAQVRMVGEDPVSFNRAREILYARQNSGAFPTRHAVTAVDPGWLREQHPLLGDVAEVLYTRRLLESMGGNWWRHCAGTVRRMGPTGWMAWRGGLSSRLAGYRGWRQRTGGSDRGTALSWPQDSGLGRY